MPLHDKDNTEKGVAAFTGGVDGNHCLYYYWLFRRVAAFTGGVDGNHPSLRVDIIIPSSPPSRAAWIEINPYFDYFNIVPSPPSRAAWIEMAMPPTTAIPPTVAAFTGGVDGNLQLISSGLLSNVAAFTGGVDGNITIQYYNTRSK